MVDVLLITGNNPPGGFTSGGCSQQIVALDTSLYTGTSGINLGADFGIGGSATFVGMAGMAAGCALSVGGIARPGTVTILSNYGMVNPQVFTPARSMSERRRTWT